jgi:hypothetical protein
MRANEGFRNSCLSVLTKKSDTRETFRKRTVAHSRLAARLLKRLYAFYEPDYKTKYKFRYVRTQIPSRAMSPERKKEYEEAWGQRVGDRPALIKQSDTHEYVSGIFLLAASEVYKLNPPKKS